MKTFERLLRTEADDIQEIVDGILAVQARYAKEQHRPLERGTHAKGICVRGTFEVFDLEGMVEDPILRARLAQGVFAKPAVYPAIIRFANAASTNQPDYKPDVRAVSFAIAVPSAGGEDLRLDFSMNNAPTFPINDAHTFATLMRVDAASGRWAKLKALASLSPGELWEIVKTAYRGVRQQRKKVQPYQRTRFWSTVPFRHGPNEAIKYSVTPLPANPATEPQKTANTLADDLVRHLNAQDRDLEFDFAVQLLDADRMRRWGIFRKDEIFWVENASVEWKEKDAPFHTLGRLRLTDGSQMPQDEGEAIYFDVNEHSTPDNQPLGSINRARWHGEAASRKARLGTLSGVPDAKPGAPLPPPPVKRGTWVGGLTVRSLAKAAVIGAIIAYGLAKVVAAGAMLALRDDGIPLKQPNEVIYADNGFGAGLHAPDRQAYYYTAQGAGLKDIRYSWFVHLEMPVGGKRIADPSVLSRFGFLVDEKTPRNPDGLPVGFSKHFDVFLNEELLDITCATCHTGQIEVTKGGRTRALRIDGGQANHAFTDASPGHFLPTLISSMAATYTDPLKFDRFARRVLGPGYPEGWWALHGELRKVIATLGGIGINEWWHGLSPTEEGYGRTDALARIGNTVFGENLGVKQNFAVGDAPVNYPSLWNIWKFDWVQYNASVSQPMARNMGEAMGVGAKYALFNPYGGPLPAGERFRSTARIDGLDSIEQTLWKLKPPAWNEELLGPITPDLAAKGKLLFNENCAGCHGPYVASPAIKKRNAPGKTADQPEWLVSTLCVNDIGTDSNAAKNFFTRTVDITRTGMTADDLRMVARQTEDTFNARTAAYLNAEIQRLRPLRDSASVAQRAAYEKQLANLPAEMERALAQIRPDSLPMGAALSYLGTMIREKAYLDGHYTAERRAELDGFGTLDRPQVIYAYKARPLAGVWATPPFLHNGSVPTVYDLLSAPGDRPKTFQVGSREYDPVKLGLAPATGFWTFDTEQSGNRNTGHEFSDDYDEKKHDKQVRPGLIGRKLTHDEKMAIIEHLKVRDDDRDAPTNLKERPSCRSGM